jgi:hypothetical protein
MQDTPTLGGYTVTGADGHQNVLHVGHPFHHRVVADHHRDPHERRHLRIAT